ncbi:MAG: NF038122 family metalloprotease [Planctomycetia bacterium]|nr:NF038122 family metalloprotease [Planctomycetia bacterium]
MIHRVFQATVIAGALTIVASQASAAMVFNFTNQGGATAQMMAGMAEAGALWSARLHDPITIEIRIKAASLPAGVLGHTDSFYDPYSYTDVRNAMLGDRLSADDFSSAGKLQAGPLFSMLINRTANNPNGVVSATPYFDTGVGGPGQAGPENNTTVRMTTANAKALGLSPPHSILLDGIITFSTQNIYDFDRSNGISPTKLDFVGVAAHEIGHVLGFDSGVDVLDGNAAAPGLNDNQLKFVTPLDLFRFSPRSQGAGGGIGVIDWTDDSVDKYLSVDGGTTPVATFSNGSTYEASHWKFNLGQGIMDPTATGGTLMQISTNDLRAFDVIGYDTATVPEPATGTLLGFALLGGLFLSVGASRTGRRG